MVQMKHPRTAVATVLQADYINGFVSHFGLKCSSFTAVNSGTSSRSPCCAFGNDEYQSVRDANQLASRNLDK